MNGHERMLREQGRAAHEAWQLAVDHRERCRGDLSRMAEAYVDAVDAGDEWAIDLYLRRMREERVRVADALAEVEVAHELCDALYARADDAQRVVSGPAAEDYLSDWCAA